MKKTSVLLSVIMSSFALVAVASVTGDTLPSGIGNYNAFSTTGTSTHYLNVDEASCNGLTDYNFTSTVGSRDSYAVSLAAVPNGAAITSVAISPCASRVSGGGTDPVMNVFYRLNGAQSSDAGSYALTGTTPVAKFATSYSVSIAKNATTTFEIGAVLTSGTKGVRLSQIKAVFTYSTPPNAPSSLTATASGTAAVLNWSDNSFDETGFLIERSTDAFSYTQIASTTASTTSYTNSGLTSGNYFYRVRATNVAGNSAYSNTASTTIP